jgi:hypothetical protein
MGTAFEIVARRGHPEFLDLPWHEPLATWSHGRLTPMAHGISRHVVRFVRYDERVYAIKETPAGLADREYRLLQQLRARNLPTVEPVAVVHGRRSSRGEPLDSVLVTRYLDFSLPYWYLIGREAGPELTRRLLDAEVVLLVRLHLDGFYWGDCSLSNVLFRRDAGALAAYLVDAETGEWHDPISDRLREADLDLAKEHLVGGVLDLQAQGRVPEELDPLLLTEALDRRYQALWAELTRPEEVAAPERWRIEQRIRGIEDLGFDVEELAIEPTADGHRLKIRPVLVEEGHHARELQRLIGLAVQENQARRLLGLIAAYRAHLAASEGADLPLSVAASRWLTERYQPVVARIPDELRNRLELAEVYHELAEHRYYLSERAGQEVGNDAALASYLETVLSTRPDERTILTDGPAEPPAAPPQGKLGQ